MSTQHLQYVSWRVGVALLLLPIAVSGFGMNLMKLPVEDKSQAACVLALLQKYFHSAQNLSGAVLCLSVTPQALDVQQALLRELNGQPAQPWSLLITTPSAKHADAWRMAEKPQCYFLVVDNLENEDFEEIFAQWRNMLNWNPLAQFVVYLSAVEETDEEMTDLMVEILLTFMNNKLLNINIIGQSEENGAYFVKSVFPYHVDNNCGKRVINVDTLDACYYETAVEAYEEQEEEQYDEELDVGNAIGAFNSDELMANSSAPTTTIEEYVRAKFKDKIPSDLSGCPIRAAFRGPWEPYIFPSSEQPTTDTAYYEQAEDAGEASNSSETNMEYDYAASYDNSADNADTKDGTDSDQTLSKQQLTGIDFQLLQTIAERLHVSINFKSQSSNVFHLFQQLMENEIDIIVGGIDEDPSISQFVSSSIPYHQDDLTWCVAKAKYKNNFFNFLASFHVNSWLLLLLFILSCSLAVLAAQHVSGVHLKNLQNYLAICLRMLGILLTQSLNISTSSLPRTMRLLFGLAFFTAFIFSNTYQSFLISTLTTPTRQAQISHLQQIYSNRMTIMVNSANVRHLNKQGEIFKYIREKFQMCYNFVHCLNDAADNEALAVAVSRQHAFYNARVPRNRLYCFDRRESLYVYQVIMLLPKQYHLLPSINSIIQHVIESGHLQKWARDLDLVRMIHERVERTAQEAAFRALTLAEFQGAFAFASGLLLLASSVCGLERLVYWLVISKRTRLRLLRCLHRRLAR
ncbi:Ir87a [Drosophila busckii]|uniref:Ir87a n=1 Tax=Drosophila busckii TaxID=30019 RepID=A0A0M4EE52_DROBS|nr:uncharacterized protein LOC108601387 [Drosophila busckii]ALC46216.1 Ir87a [Drosophila busckii]